MGWACWSGECAAAGSQVAQLAGQAATAHAEKVDAIGREIQNQLWLTAGTSMIGSPEVGGAIAKAVGGVAARLGGEVVGRIVAGIVETISELLRRVLAAFNELFARAAKLLPYTVSHMRDKADGIAALKPHSRGGLGVSANTGGATHAPSSVRVSDAQFGAKAAQHMRDFGLDVTNPADRSKFRDMITNVAAKPDEVRRGPWHPRAGGSSDYLFFRQGSVVVVAKADGAFVTVLSAGDVNSWFQAAMPL